VHRLQVVVLEISGSKILRKVDDDSLERKIIIVVIDDSLERKIIIVIIDDSLVDLCNWRWPGQGDASRISHLHPYDPYDRPWRLASPFPLTKI
jgi:hypothetical protein